MSMTEEQSKVLQQLRNLGYAVCVFTPEEIGEADADELEDVLCERGYFFIEQENGQ